MEYIILDASRKKKPEKAKPLALYSFDDGYDIEKYTEMTLKAVETLLLPFGFGVERLKECMVVSDETSTSKSGKHKSKDSIGCGLSDLFANLIC